MPGKEINTTAAPARLNIELEIERVEDVSARLDELESRVNIIVNKIMGPIPADTVSAESTPTSLIDRLNYASSCCNTSISAINANLNRLEA